MLYIRLSRISWINLFFSGEKNKPELLKVTYFSQPTHIPAMVVYPEKTLHVHFPTLYQTILTLKWRVFKEDKIIWSCFQGENSIRWLRFWEIPFEKLRLVHRIYSRNKDCQVYFRFNSRNEDVYIDWSFPCWELHHWIDGASLVYFTTNLTTRLFSEIKLIEKHSLRAI